ncbi:alpha/beta hydrolase [Enemella evansiae]|uniref:alpha/beta fold hydrolase n=1 Tax=Enemella evansiae TaxID=2016499 RepID=UPI000B97283A|nr:alpha/beta hydrolase [Enemella evansiae]OYN98732.1 alpha/beta hydrolase [Enemella evansiae]
MTTAGFAGFTELSAEANGITLRGIASLDGPEVATPRPPLLLLHGHPETHLMWRKVADRFAEDFQVVAPDLRGYGASDKPPTEPDHASYSFRAMAQDLVELMRGLGFERFAIAAHDRGARATARLLADHPGLVSSAVLMDIAPTLDMYAGTDQAFATAYWHWFFLIQPSPLPEELINANPNAYVARLMGMRHGNLDPFAGALDAYQEAVADPEAVRAMCEDYRAAASIDLDHDRADREAGVLISTPLRVLWGRHGVVHKLFDPLTLWRQVATDVSGRALDCGHYLPEERPDEVYAEVREFTLAHWNASTPDK